MKKILLLFLLILFCLPVASYAHSGGTDANGGHYNRSTGEYHYHHGYSAHQHPNGICPYDYDDQTGSSSGSSSGSYISSLVASSGNTYSDGYDDGYDIGYETGYSNGEDSGYENGYHEGYDTAVSENTFNFKTGIASGVVGSFLLYFIFRLIKSGRDSAEVNEFSNKVERYKKKILDDFHTLQIDLIEKEQKLSESIKRLQSQKTLLEQSISSMEKRKTCLKEELSDIQLEINELCNTHNINYSIIPDGIVIGEDGLPKDADAPLRWGKTFTVYLNEQTSVYHKGSCRYVNSINCRPVHILFASKYCTPCKFCKPKTPDTRWFDIYTQEKDALRKQKEAEEGLEKFNSDSD